MTDRVRLTFIGAHTLAPNARIRPSVRSPVQLPLGGRRGDGVALARPRGNNAVGDCTSAPYRPRAMEQVRGLRGRDLPGDGHGSRDAWHPGNSDALPQRPL